jgi:hypothetical protein
MRSFQCIEFRCRYGPSTTTLDTIAVMTPSAIALTLSDQTVRETDNMFSNRLQYELSVGEIDYSL